MPVKTKTQEVFVTITELERPQHERTPQPRQAPQPSQAARHNGTRNSDDALVPVAGIVDVLDNYAFVRTSGYLAGPNDVYVSMAQIKQYGLRRGDAVTGAVRAARDNDTGA